MATTASLKIDDKEYPLPVIIGTEGEKAVDTRALRTASGYVSFDQGYGNTGSCESQITYLDGDNGILRHRGYPIEQLAHFSDFVETAYLVIYGELPNPAQRKEFGLNLRKNAVIETQMQKILEGFPTSASPMAMLSAMVSALPAYYPHLATNNFEQDLKNFDSAAAIAMSKIRTIVAMIYRYQKGLPFVFPKQELPFCENFLHMLFSEPYQDYVPVPEVAKALNLVLLLHGRLDHGDLLGGRRHGAQPRNGQRDQNNDVNDQADGPGRGVAVERRLVLARVFLKLPARTLQHAHCSSSFRLNGTDAAVGIIPRKRRPRPSRQAWNCSAPAG